MERSIEIIQELNQIKKSIESIEVRSEKAKELNRKNGEIDDTYFRITIGVFLSNLWACRKLLEEEINRIQNENK